MPCSPDLPDLHSTSTAQHSRSWYVPTLVPAELEYPLSSRLGNTLIPSRCAATFEPSDGGGPDSASTKVKKKTMTRRCHGHNLAPSSTRLPRQAVEPTVTQRFSTYRRVTQNGNAGVRGPNVRRHLVVLFPVLGPLADVDGHIGAQGSMPSPDVAVAGNVPTCVRPDLGSSAGSRRQYQSGRPSGPKVRVNIVSLTH